MQKKLIAINNFLMTALKSLNPWDAKIEFINYLRNNNNKKYFKKWVVDGNTRGYGKQEKLY